jgi:glycosyltransferase involved in cell wall biosynthesis/tetratricopeptide (TPR) repeat protein
LVVFKFMIIGRKHTKQAWLPRFIGESFERWTSADRASRLRELREAADAARDQHDWAAAVKLYGEVSAEDPSASDIAVQLGHAHKELGDYDRAGQLYYATLIRKPGDDDLHLQIGHLEKLRNNVAKAMEHYKKSAELNPKNVDALREYDALKGRTEFCGNGEPKEARGRQWFRTQPPGGNQVRPRSSDSPAPQGERPELLVPAKFGQSSNAELRAAGDRARDARLWLEAAPAYEAYLERVPRDAAIWVQLGHCLKETGDLAGGEAAYRRALSQRPEDADLHLQLGHVLKLRGRRHEAVEAYRRSFALKPLLAPARELKWLGSDFASEVEILEPEARTPEILFEISDLFAALLDSRTISGIQRVQIGIISHILEEHARGKASHCHIVVWEGDELWRIRENCLATFLRVYEDTGDGVFERRRELIDEEVTKSELLRPVPGDIVVSTGTIYQQPDLLMAHARLKRAGVRLGAYIHDFIPLTHPEFCDWGLTDAFLKTMADALLHYDFALTVSEHVERELRRLLAQGGYPAIPTRAVPEAHARAVPAGVAEDDWTSAIAAVQGREFVLCVGTLSSHKNQALLLQIWQLLLRDGIEPPMLVLIGRRGHNIIDLLSQLSTTNNIGGRVHIIEGLIDSELQTLYCNCLFTMVPSFVEGWGLPVGESLAHGKVCIASDAASLPEVGGDFVLYIDPYNARGAASLVRRLLDDRTELRRLEARIRNEFRPRTWQEHGAALIRAAEELGRTEPPSENRPKVIAIPLGKVVRPFLIDTGWEYGTRLPPRRILADRALRRLLLERGWCRMESWGTWMDGRQSRIGFTIEGAPGGRVRVVLQFRATAWARGNQLRIRAACGAATTVPVPESRHTAETCPHFLALLDCTPDKSGRIELSLEIVGAIQEPRWGETRRICVGLARMLCLDPAEISERLPPNQIIRPVALTGSMGAAIVPRGTASLIAALQHRTVLVDGWYEPEAWGAWMAGRTAHLALTAEAAPGEAVSVAVQLRVPPGRDTEVTVRSDCGAAARRRVPVADPRYFPVWLDCRVGPDGDVRLAIEVTNRPANTTADLQVPPLGITGFAYGRQGSAANRLALAEALLFPQPLGEGEVCRKALDKDLRFSVIGHMNGSYSIATVNRFLAAALEGARAGTVRIEQVEGQPVRDLCRVPAAERPAIATLARRERHEDGPAVEIAQHWPVWVPQHPTDLKLAWVPWEESLVPLDMVRLLNEKFQGILVQTRFVAKALIDSGVRLPIRVMGCAINLDAYAALGAERAASPALRRPTKAAPFVLLHVSSCFPRKGVDALLAAYAKTFRRRDLVRLVIKGFPNPHNDVPEQIARLRSLDPDAPEIVMINRDQPANELVALYREADAMVLPTRGEGFNMPAAEALAAGLPLIVTGYSGQTDFAGPDVARQVEFRFAPSRTHMQSCNSVWADPDVDDLSAAMREVFDAAGDTVPGRELAARVERGRRAALPLGNAAAWAARVRDIAIDLLSLGPMNKWVAPTVAWVTTWNIRCGIATHSRYLLDPYPDAARDVTVLCDERTQLVDLASPGGPAARIAWRVSDPATADRLADEIAATGARAVVIQHQPGLIWPDVLTRLLGDDRLVGREIILTVHNLRELVDWEDWDRLLDAFRRVSRLLVHNVRDLNLLKSYGVLGNVALFPPGALRPTIVRHPARELPGSAAPVIGTYGFILPDKGFDALIEALARVRADWPGATLRMVTAKYPVDESAAEIARCRELARSLGLEGAVEWHTDFLPDEESLALLNHCDLLVLPRRESTESASGAARVAMASRVPVLVTPVEMFDEMGDAVIRSQGVDSSALASGIAAALRNQNLRNQTVDEADRWLEEHDWVRMSERLYGMICGLVMNQETCAPAGRHER